MSELEKQDKPNVVVPIVAVVLAMLWVISTGIPRSATVPPIDNPPEGVTAGGEYDLDAFGSLPIVYEGRTKPMDTLARNSLMIISKRTTFVERLEDGKTAPGVESEGPGAYDDGIETKRQPAIRWLADVMARPNIAFEHRVFRIENEDVLNTLGLEQRKGLRYAFNEFNNDKALKALDAAANDARRKKSSERDLYDTKILEIAEAVHLFHRLMGTHDIPNIQDMSSVINSLQRFRTQLERFDLVHTVAPASLDGKWQPFLPALLHNRLSGVPAPELAPVLELMKDYDADAENLQSMYVILASYALGDAGRFNNEIDSYRARIARTFGPAAQRANVEVVFNRVAPFYDAAVLYWLIFGIACLSLMAWGPTLRSTGFWLMFAAFVFHTMSLLTRMYLQERWGVFVTNLYSSAVFVGWGVVLLTLILERIFRNGLATIAGAMIGGTTAIVAHGLSTDGDTLTQLQAVLDTNFWLATHVTTVTYGYAAVFLAGAFGIIYILAGLLSTELADRQFRLNLGRMMYGVLCFAVFLSFTGTVLGGIWADQSWGRFWGWDPKENGALMIVLWAAMILHARWGGMIQLRGIAVLCVLGNIIVAWSWFGVNMLGVGLHSYGFMGSAPFWLMLFAISQLIIAGLGCLPMSMWRSFNGAAAKPDTPPPLPA